MTEIKTIKDCYKIRGNKNIHELMALKESFISSEKYGFIMNEHCGYIFNLKTYQPFNK